MAAADFYVHSLPGLSQDDADTLTMHAGHIGIDSARDAALFFWLVERHHKTSSKVLVIWLNGGPGCSSMDGMFLENGPFRILSNGTLELNQYSWFYNVDLLFLDQPVGTGFSFGSKIPKSMPEIAFDFTLFLDNFYRIFPRFHHHTIFIAGESFAGTYIPYIATEILKVDNRPYKLGGIIIGNGWMDPIRQYSSYVDYATRHKLIPPAVTSTLAKKTRQCLDRLNVQETIKDDVCESLMQIILAATREEYDLS